MKKIIVMAILLMIPQLAVARVYMCVDHTTGESSFTDKACDAESAREEVRVQPANLDSGSRHGETAKPKTWRSEMDTRKTGLDYNADRRSAYQSKRTAVAQQ